MKDIAGVPTFNRETSKERNDVQPAVLSDLLVIQTRGLRLTSNKLYHHKCRGQGTRDPKFPCSSEPPFLTRWPSLRFFKVRKLDRYPSQRTPSSAASLSPSITDYMQIMGRQGEHRFKLRMILGVSSGDTSKCTLHMPRYYDRKY
jgi:hypothetical protein